MKRETAVEDLQVIEFAREHFFFNKHFSEYRFVCTVSTVIGRVFLMNLTNASNHMQILKDTSVRSEVALRGIESH